MSLNHNVKTFALAAVKPLILALKNVYDYDVKYMLKIVEQQNSSIQQLQTQYVELINKITVGVDAYLEATKKVTEMENKLYTADQVSTLSYRCQQLEAIVTQLYTLVATKLPNETLPSLDPWLDSDPLPTAADLETRWRVNMGLDSDATLTDEQQTSLTTYITEKYSTYPELPEYPTKEDGTLLTDEEIEAFYREYNGLDSETELTEDQAYTLQAFIDCYTYLYRNTAS